VPIRVFSAHPSGVRCGASRVSRSRSTAPPVRADRHLLPVQPGVDRRRGRGFLSCKGFHRRCDHPERDGAAHRARRPGHLDDIEAGVRVARRPRRDPHPFPTASLKRQSLCRGAVQDAEVPARLPGLVRWPDRGPRIPRRILHRVQPRTQAFRGIGWHTAASVHFGTARRGRRRTAGHPGRRPGHSPRTLRPTSPTTQNPRSERSCDATASRVATGRAPSPNASLRPPPSRKPFCGRHMWISGWQPHTSSSSPVNRWNAS